MIRFLDLGYLKYKENGIKQNYQITQIDGSNSNDGIDITQFFKNYQGEFQFDTLGMRVTGSSQNTFSVMLPLALSGQIDYNLENGFYIDASMVQGLTFRGWLGARRPHSISLTPRYESKKFEVALPIIWYNFTRLRPGFMVRYKWITIGSDNIAGLLPPGKKIGADAYIHLKIPFFSNGRCGEGKQKKTKLAPCPAFI